ncbi:MAG: L-aspartate oxidase [Acidobacteriota bacterium]
MRTLRADFTVVGSGVAGLRAALVLAAAGDQVLLVSKDPPAQSATGTAQGGVAAAMSDDDEIGLHYRDTLKAGDGICSPVAVRVLVGEGPEAISQLLAWGVRFNREGRRLAFGREAAHSKRRILHAHDSTGREILRALVDQARSFQNVRRISDLFTLDLLVAGNRVTGVLCLDERRQTLVRIFSRAVLLATGGLGQVYHDTTNPAQATGDGVAMAFRAGAAVSNLEFVQFHPTALFCADQPRHLLTEALRGEGAVLRNARAERFLVGRLPGAELAPRDRLSRAIDGELSRSRAACVFLDCEPIGAERLEQRFPGVVQTCRAAGIDPVRRLVPVRPAAHYAMGGVETDLYGRTSLKGLYAAGEVACAGVHGANRLASNSLLEGLVFGARAAAAMLREAEPGIPGEGALAPGLRPDFVAERQAQDTIRRLKAWMWSDAGLVRDRAGLCRLLSRLERAARGAPRAEPSRAGAEARNQLTVARLIARLALWRRESRGAHFRTDFPGKSRAFRGRSRWIRGGEPHLPPRGLLDASPRPARRRPGALRRVHRRFSESPGKSGPSGSC